jgi:hypothetical protein
MRKHNFHNNERGVALLIALLALILISAIGLGMVYMSSTETAINSNYKDTQTAFFSMRGGLEEMRDRMRSNSVQPVPALTFPLVPAAMPGAAANSIVYITNPSGVTDTVDPMTFGNQYFDDEFCHESFAGSGVTYKAPGTPCDATGAPPLGSVALPYVASQAPYTNTAASLKYKWARITMKQNGTFPSTPVDSTQAASSPVCWDAMGNQEVVASALGYVDCNAAAAAGLNVSPAYLVTSMAVTPQGSRRIGQYEVAAFTITPPPSALSLDGPAAVFNPAPSSINYFANGNNSGAAAFTGPGGPAACTATGPAQVPAISTGDQQGVTNIAGNPPGTGSIPSNRINNYTGTGGTPSVVNSGPTGSNQLSGTWSTPSALNNLVAQIANGADQSFTCGIGAPCNFPATGLGTDAAPLITFVNGDFNFGANSGSGVLVVTGTLNITGNSSFNGLILIIGQGQMTESGSGNGQFNGSIFLAKTNTCTNPSSPPQCTQLAALQSPLIAWNGGGSNGIQYNSCWANIGNKMHYTVVASREEMY